MTTRPASLSQSTRETNTRTAARISKDGQERIREARLQQPLSELRRKAHKACCRANLWTVEELDYAAARGRDMADALAPLLDDEVTAPPRDTARKRAKPEGDRMSVGEIE